MKNLEQLIFDILSVIWIPNDTTNGQNQMKCIDAIFLVLTDCLFDVELRKFPE